MLYHLVPTTQTHRYCYETTLTTVSCNLVKGITDTDYVLCSSCKMLLLSRIAGSASEAGCDENQVQILNASIKGFSTTMISLVLQGFLSQFESHCTCFIPDCCKWLRCNGPGVTRRCTCTTSPVLPRGWLHASPPARRQHPGHLHSWQWRPPQQPAGSPAPHCTSRLLKSVSTSQQPASGCVVLERV